MYKECYMPDCERIVISKCQCSNETYICEHHMANHTSMQGQHPLTNLLIDVSMNNSNHISDYFKYNKKVLNQNIVKLLSYTENLVKIISSESDKLLKKLLKQQKMLNKTMNMFKQSSKIYSDLYEDLYYKRDSHLHEFIFNFEECERVIKAAYDIELLDPTLTDDNFAIIFPSYLSRCIDFLDLSNLKSMNYDFKVGEYVHFCTCCKIDKMKYLVIGGDPNSQSSVKIIDLKSCTTSDIIKTEFKFSLAGGCYFKNEVFVFGGINFNMSTKICSKFNLNTKTWKSIDSLPKPNFSTTASRKGGNIYVVGHGDDKIYTYDPKKNSFKYLKTSFESGNEKFLIKNWLVCFGFCLYEIDDKDNLIRRQTFTWTTEFLNSSAYFKKGEYLYFATRDLVIYRINIKDKTIEKVGTYRSPDPNVNNSLNMRFSNT